MEFNKVLTTFSFYYWFVNLKNDNLIDHKIYSYWSEYGGLDKIFNHLPLANNIQIGECFYFDLNSDHIFGTLRNLTQDFNTNYFQILRIKNDFIAGESFVDVYKSYDLSPYYEKKNNLLYKKR